MLKALDDLEKAVTRMMDKARTKVQDGPGSEVDQSLAGKGAPGRKGEPSAPVNEEAAEFIRRALKRLKSL